MKINKIYKKGITLFETLISTIIFGIIMILMFQMFSSFFKLFSASESQQSVNSKFIKAYNLMQREFMVTDAKNLYTYKYKFESGYKNIKNRWIVFPVPTNKSGQFQGEGNSFNWKRIFIYYLICTNPECTECNKTFLNLEESYKHCSDKQLIRLIYDYNGSNDRNFFASALYTFCDDITSYILSYDSTFPNNKTYKIVNYNQEKNIFKFAEKKIIATDIFDLNIKQDQKNVTILLSSLKKEEIKKEITYETTDFTKKENSKYINKFEFTINTRNND